MIPQERDRLIEQLAFVKQTRFEILPTQFSQHFLSGFVTHIVVHAG
jgi:hypothetical protein